MPFNLGIGEVLVVLVVALLIFGKRLPEVGRSLGRGIVEFKEGLKGAAASLSSKDELTSEVESPPEPATEVESPLEPVADAESPPEPEKVEESAPDSAAEEEPPA